MAGAAPGTTPQLGVRAVFDDADAQKHMDRYTRRMQQVEKSLDSLEKRTVTAGKRAADAGKKSSDTQMKALRALRWELVTVLFFFRLFTRVMRAGWERLAESVEERAMVEGVQALARAYENSLVDITRALEGVSGEAVNTFDLVRTAQAGLLTDHGQFVNQYAGLWESARLAAAVTGAEANKVFEAMVKSLAKADGAILDGTVSIYQMETALMAYAVASGRTVDMLSTQEKQQVMLNRVQEVTNALIASGAQAALDAKKPTDALSRAWHEFTGAAVTAVRTTGIVEFLTRVAKTAAQTMAIIAATYESIMTGAQMLQVVLASVLTGEFIDPKEIGDAMYDAYMEAFQRVAEGMGVIFEDAPAAGMDVDADMLLPGFDAAAEDALKKYHDFLERVNKLNEQYQRRLEDLYINHARQLEDIEWERQRRIEDIMIDAQRRREDLLRRYHRALEDAERQYQRALERIDWDNSRQRRRIWERYWEELRRIQERYQDSMYDAIAKRDATQALMAIRQRNRDLERAARDRDRALRDIREDYQRQIDEARRRLEEQRADARRSYQEGLEDLARYVAEQLDELERSLQRQREDLERHLEWRLNRLKEEYRLEYLEAYVAYTGQEQLLADHVRRMQEIWNAFLVSMGLPGIPTYPSGGSAGGFQHGGAFIASGRTTATFGEGGKPELVVAIPMGGQRTSPPSMVGPSSVRHQVGGGVQHQVTGIIEQSMAGFEGRLAAAFESMLRQVIR
jgi:hypothetical protein